VGSKYTKRYTEEFKRDAIALVDSSGKTVTAVARELGLSSESLRGWYRKAKAEQGEGTAGGLSSAEHEELKRPATRCRPRSSRSGWRPGSLAATAQLEAEPDDEAGQSRPDDGGVEIRPAPMPRNRDIAVWGCAQEVPMVPVRSGHVTR
jgi:transposase